MLILIAEPRGQEEVGTGDEAYRQQRDRHERAAIDDMNREPSLSTMPRTWLRWNEHAS